MMTLPAQRAEVLQAALRVLRHFVGLRHDLARLNAVVAQETGTSDEARDLAEAVHQALGRLIDALQCDGFTRDELPLTTATEHALERFLEALAEDDDHFVGDYAFYDTHLRLAEVCGPDFVQRYAQPAHDA